jgi:hypothetical protein
MQSRLIASDASGSRQEIEMKVHGIKTSRTIRATKINAHALKEGGKLMQWNCSYHGQQTMSGGKVYKYITSSFVSLVTRPGMPGIWVDAPYYCAAGPHRYRRVPVGLEIKIRIACGRGVMHQTADKAARLIQKYYARALPVFTYFSQESIAERRRRAVAEQAWNDLWREFGKK